MEKVIENLQYIKAGKIGCTFASVAAKMMLDGKDLKWQFINHNELSSLSQLTGNTISIMFPNTMSIPEIRDWCKEFGFEEVQIKKGTKLRRFKRFIKGQKLIGLRLNHNNYQSWVMYFGQDAHCPTRKTPNKMITFRFKKPTDAYELVGFKNNVLHIAQMTTYLFELSKFKLSKLWFSSHNNSKK